MRQRRPPLFSRHDRVPAGLLVFGCAVFGAAESQSLVHGAIGALVGVVIFLIVAVVRR